jgi:origin recognition complex subunit 1
MSALSSASSNQYHATAALPASNSVLFHESWTGSELSSRPTTTDDLDPAEDWDATKPCTTSFYTAFSRPVGAQKQVRTYGRASRTKDREENKVFTVGETVLVRTSAPKPSVGLIIGMWGIKVDEDQREDQQDEEDDDEPEEERMRVLIHWFTQPWELPRVRAKRDHLEVSTCL